MRPNSSLQAPKNWYYVFFYPCYLLAKNWLDIGSDFCKIGKNMCFYPWFFSIENACFLMSFSWILILNFLRVCVRAGSPSTNCCQGKSTMWPCGWNVQIWTIVRVATCNHPKRSLNSLMSLFKAMWLVTAELGFTQIRNQIISLTLKLGLPNSGILLSLGQHRCCLHPSRPFWQWMAQTLSQPNRCYLSIRLLSRWNLRRPLPKLDDPNENNTPENGIHN